MLRWLLSVSIAIWMAGGCLFGCSSTAMAAESEHPAQTTIAHHSCHMKMASNSQQSKEVAFTPAPHGMMKDCPLVVNATAATSKNSGHEPYPGRVPVSTPLLVESKIEQPNTSHVVAFLPNRGPTHLRCCVFLI